jgi:hypothetical protein
MTTPIPGLLLTATLFSLAPTAVSAVVAFDGTGADLFADPGATFPTGTPAVVGSALELPASVASEILLVYPLAEALSFAPDEGVVATFTLTLNRQSDDFDPVFLVTDGIEAVGGQVGDNPNGSARLIEGTVAGDSILIEGDPEIFTGAGFPAIGETVDATVEIALGNASSDIRVTFLAGDATVPSTKVLDRTAALSFLLVANSNIDGEVYRIESAVLEIEVPEPAAPALLAAGAAVLALGARTRKRRTACA